MQFLLLLMFDHRDSTGSTKVGTYGPYSKKELEEVMDEIVKNFNTRGYEKISVTTKWDIRGPMPISLADRTGALPTIRLGVEVFRQPDASEVLYELTRALKIGHHASPTAPPGT